MTSHVLRVVPDPSCCAVLFRLQAAGVLPTSIALIFVCATSSLCGTFLSQTIAAIPGEPFPKSGLELCVCI